MKEITLRVPDHMIDFVLELFEQLGLEVSEEPEIPEEHKDFVWERIRSVIFCTKKRRPAIHLALLPLI